jgi:protein DGCR14
MPSSDRSLNRQVILEEEEYASALSHIIARDFFPSLVHLDATNEHLNAPSSRDPHLIEASVTRIRDLGTPGPSSQNQKNLLETPYNLGISDTPLSQTNGDGQRPAKRPRYDTSLNLDTFQARYTSEDNASFTQILEDENRQRKEKWGWAWDAEKRVQAQRDRMIEATERMMLEPSPAAGVREKFLIEVPTPAALLTEKGEVNSSSKQVEIQPRVGEWNGREKERAVDVMAPKKDMRPAGVDGWKFKVRI